MIGEAAVHGGDGDGGLAHRERRDDARAGHRGHVGGRARPGDGLGGGVFRVDRGRQHRVAVEGHSLRRVGDFHAGDPLPGGQHRDDAAGLVVPCPGGDDRHTGGNGRHNTLLIHFCHGAVARAPGDRRVHTLGQHRGREGFPGLLTVEGHGVFAELHAADQGFRRRGGLGDGDGNSFKVAAGGGGGDLRLANAHRRDASLAAHMEHLGVRALPVHRLRGALGEDGLQPHHLPQGKRIRRAGDGDRSGGDRAHHGDRDRLGNFFAGVPMEPNHQRPLSGGFRRQIAGGAVVCAAVLIL